MAAELNWNAAIAHPAGVFFSDTAYAAYSSVGTTLEQIAKKYEELSTSCIPAVNAKTDDPGDVTTTPPRKSVNSEIRSPPDGSPQSDGPAYEPLHRKIAIRVAFPRLSWLTMKEHAVYLELYHKFFNGPPPHPNSQEIRQMNQFKDLQMKVTSEQEEFMVYLEHVASNALPDYNFIHPEAGRYVDAYVQRERARVKNYPQYYKILDTVSLAPPRVPTEIKLKHVQTLLEMGKVPKIILPTFGPNMPPLPMKYSKINSRFPVDKDSKNLHKKIPVCSQDQNCNRLADKYSVDFVICSSALLYLLDNPSGYPRQWEIAVTVSATELPTADEDEEPEFRRTIYIDKPFVSKTLVPRERNQMFFKSALKTQWQHPNHCNSYDFKPEEKTSPKLTKKDDVTPSDTKGEAKDETAKDETEIQNVSDTSPRSGMEETVKKIEGLDKIDEPMVKPQSDRVDVEMVAIVEEKLCSSNVTEPYPEPSKLLNDGNVPDILEKATPNDIVQDKSEPEGPQAKGFITLPYQGMDYTVNSPYMYISSAEDDSDEEMLVIDVPQAPVPAAESGTSRADQVDSTVPAAESGTSRADQVDSTGNTKSSEAPNSSINSSFIQTSRFADASAKSFDSDLEESDDKLEICAADDADVTGGSPEKAGIEPRTSLMSEDTTESPMSPPLEFSECPSLMPEDTTESPMSPPIEFSECPASPTLIPMSKEVHASPINIPVERSLPDGSDDVPCSSQRSAGTGSPPNNSPNFLKKMRFSGIEKESASIEDFQAANITVKISKFGDEILPAACPKADTLRNEGMVSYNVNSSRENDTDIKPNLTSSDTTDIHIPPASKRRKSGQPKSTANVNASETDIKTEVEMPVKRKRGRPPKKSTVPQIKQEESTISDNRALSQTRNTRQKVQAKAVDSAPTDYETDDVKLVISEDFSAISTTKVTNVLTPAPPPSQATAAMASVHTKNFYKSPPQIPTIRGSESPSMTTVPGEQISTITPPPRRRGRPRKNPVPTETAVPLTATVDRDQETTDTVKPSPSEGVSRRSSRRSGSGLRASPSQVSGLMSAGNNRRGGAHVAAVPIERVLRNQREDVFGARSNRNKQLSDSLPQLDGSDDLTTPESDHLPQLDGTDDQTKPQTSYNTVGFQYQDPNSGEQSGKDEGRQSHRGQGHTGQQRGYGRGRDQGWHRGHGEDHFRGRGRGRGRSRGRGRGRGYGRGRGQSECPLDNILQAQDRMLQSPPRGDTPWGQGHEERGFWHSNMHVPDDCPEYIGPLEDDTWQMTEVPEEYSAPESDNVSYSLHELAGIKLLVRCKYHGIFRPFKRRESNFVHILPKLEYQPQYGFEKATHSDVTAGWLAMQLRKKCKVIRARINAYTSDVMKIEHIDSSNVLPPRSPFNPALGLRVLDNILKRLKQLAPGKYLLSHSAGQLHFQIKQVTQSAVGTYDLHKAHGPAAKVNVESTYGHVPWVPVDPSLMLPFHKRRQRIPSTFEPKDCEPCHTFVLKNRMTKAEFTKHKKRKNKKKNRGKPQRN